MQLVVYFGMLVIFPVLHCGTFHRVAIIFSGISLVSTKCVTEEPASVSAFLLLRMTTRLGTQSFHTKFLMILIDFHALKVSVYITERRSFFNVYSTASNKPCISAVRTVTEELSFFFLHGEQVDQNCTTNKKISFNIICVNVKVTLVVALYFRNVLLQHFIWSVLLSLYRQSDVTTKQLYIRTPSLPFSKSISQNLSFIYKYVHQFFYNLYIFHDRS